MNTTFKIIILFNIVLTNPIFGQNQIHNKSKALTAGYYGPIKQVSQNSYKAKKKAGKIIPDSKLLNKSQTNFKLILN